MQKILSKYRFANNLYLLSQYQTLITNICIFLHLYSTLSNQIKQQKKTKIKKKKKS